jgi:single-stranded DNA-binding protein
MTEVIIQGFLGRDAAVRETEKGGKFLSFTVCSNDFVAGKQKEQWFDCIWFDHNDKMVEYLKKGSCVNVVGGLDADIEKGDDGKSYIRRRVTVHFVTFAASSKAKEDAQQSAATEPEQEVQVTKQTSKATKTPPADEEITVGVAKTKKFSAEEDNNSDLPF